jgi:hypothetical protein
VFDSAFQHNLPSSVIFSFLTHVIFELLLQLLLPSLTIKKMLAECSCSQGSHSPAPHVHVVVFERWLPKSLEQARDAFSRI